MMHTRRVPGPVSSSLSLLAGSAALLALATSSARADVKLPAVLSDHMVLQQGMPVPVWGTADNGEEVTVTFGDHTQKTKAEGGKWSVKLPALKASDKPAELTVQGKNKVTLNDILVGEVWVCSGQSNMEFNVGSARNSKDEIAKAEFPNIRLFTVNRDTPLEPLTDTKGNWAACSPKNVGGFSAVGFFFGRDLHEKLHVPIGLIHTSWGGTIAEAWTPREALERDAEYSEILKRADEAREKKGDPNRAAVLYNGMIAPIVPFAARGATWYQGESNAGRAEQYRKLLPTMIQSWREAWHEPEFKFLIVSLANFQQPPKEPGDSDWAELRDAQWMTGQQPNNGVALAIDLADPENPNDIHPKNKQDVGHRLALIALHDDYGKSDVVCSGPVYESLKVDGNKAHLKFKSADDLHAKGGSDVKGFQIAGEDKKWHWADAKVEGDSVVVTSDKVEKPVAVRYDWAHNPQGNLYNKADLPMSPFRTDDWPGVTAGKK